MERSDNPLIEDPLNESRTLSISVVGAIDAVPAQDWNAAAGATNPFVRHELLKALETENCLGKRTGWFPRHLLVHRGERLVGATPAYIKTNSYGEFVFDWAFADAYQRAGLDYYPKLVAAVPFTPAPGPRLLVVPDEDVATVREHLMLGAIAFAKQEDLSSVHWLFPEQAHHEALSKQGLLTRMGYQFHWRNHGYRDFQDFLDCLTHKRRKEIRRERRDVEKAALDIEIMWGRDTEECHWAAFHQFYCAIYDRKWGFPSLTLDFFLRLAETLPDSTLLIMARNGGRYIAGTYSVCGTDTLFGRNWGCIENHRGLHFELCYYRHIEIAIEHGLGRLEAGAQGEHKLSRGFMPVPTHSAHWFAHAGFRDAIARLLVEEAGDVQSYLNAAAEHSPFKSESHPPADRSGTGQ